MQTFQILMVGPTRVGKTSTLASMSDSLRTAVNRLQYNTTIPDQLLQTIHQFRNVVDQNDIVVKTLPLQTGTGDKTSYMIDLISQNMEKDISIEFIDLPGGWYNPPTQDIPNVHYDEVKKLLQNSIASLWCIDSVSMIEGRNNPEYKDYHIDRNAPNLITELYRNINMFSTTHRIIFVLMRAETYLHDNVRNAQWLMEQFNNFYGQYIEHIKMLYPNGKVEIYLTYVETLGCFRFSSWQRNIQNNELEAIFRRFANQYAPFNCEAPALLVIDRSLQEALTFFEKKKNDNLDYYRMMRKNFVIRNLSWLVRSILGGDANEYFRIEDIYHNLANNMPIAENHINSMEFEANPYLNAHIIYKRLKEAADTMTVLVNEKKVKDLVRLL